MSTSPASRIRVFLLLAACLLLGAVSFGAAIPLPGSVAASAFSNSYDIDSGSNNNNPGPDLAASNEGGQYVGWINATEWIEYDVVATEAAVLKITARVASPSTAGSPGMDLLLDGAKVASCSTSTTGGWQTWVDAPFDTSISLQSGQTAKLRVVFTTSGFNFAKLTLTRTGVPHVLNVDTSTATYEIAGGTTTVHVTSDTTWAAASDAAWLTAAPASGSGNGTITLTAPANANSYRNATVTLLGGGITRTISVTQKGQGLSFLKAVGQDLKDNNGAGEVVQLKGVNLGGQLLQENWMSPLGADDEWTARGILFNRFGVAAANDLISQYEDFWLQESDLDNVKSYGFNMVRVPIYWEHLMNRDGTMRANPWTKLDRIVAQCAARDLYVVLDLHGTPGGLNGWQSGGRLANELWSNSTYQQWTEDIWRAMAAHFRGNPVICGYDLLNEPVSNNSALNEGQLYDRLYRAVRSVDPEHVVIIENGFDPSYHWTNVVFQSHHYDFGSSGDGAKQLAFAQGELAKIRQWKQDYNVPVYVGEYCFYDYANVWETWMGGLNQMGASWSAWTYKVKGNMGNWGLFNNNGNPSPDLNNDSQATIVAKWSKFTTANFNSNTSFQALIKKYAAKPAPIAIPGTVEAEDYTGMSGIQTETCSEGGQDVGYIGAGAYLTYHVIVQSAGQYTVDYRTAGTGTGGIRLEQASDNFVLGTISVPPTGAWQTWKTISNSVTLRAGDQTIRLVATAGGFNINWLKFTKLPDATITPSALSFPAGGGSQSVALACTGPWAVSNTVAWLTASPTSGSGNSTVIFTATANTGAPRTATLSFQVGGQTCVLGATQAASINTPPTLTSIPDQTISANTASAAIPFVIGDAQTPAASLSLSASSDNAVLLPLSSIVFAGSGANRTVTFTPAANRTGIAAVTVQVSDSNGALSTVQFTVTVNTGITNPMVDRNGDGISDIWAGLYPNVGGPAGDPDGDGQSNLAEAQAGTDPTDANSRLAASVERDATGNLVVRWLGVAGKHYLLEGSGELHNWTPLPGEYIGAGAVLSVIVRDAGVTTDTRTFWHVVAFDADSTGSGLNDWERAHVNSIAMLTATGGPNGSISPRGKSYVSKGSNFSYSIVPSSGYMIDQVLVDGQSVGVPSAYTFSAIASNHSIEVTFKLLPPLP